MVLEEQMEEKRRAMRTKIEAKNSRIQKSIENNLAAERKKEEDYQQSLMEDAERNARMDEEKRLLQEQAGRRALAMYMKRRQIAEGAAEEVERRSYRTWRMWICV